VSFVCRCMIVAAQGIGYIAMKRHVAEKSVWPVRKPNGFSGASGFPAGLKICLIFHCGGKYGYNFPAGGRNRQKLPSKI